MTDFDDENHQNIVANFAEHPIVADPISPLPGSVGGQGFPVDSRVLAILEVFGDPRIDEASGISVEFPELFKRLFAKANLPFPHL